MRRLSKNYYNCEYLYRTHVEIVGWYDKFQTDAREHEALYGKAIVLKCVIWHLRTINWPGDY